jgi:hypothetical protein
MILGRLILRFILVPLGWCVAIGVASAVIVIGNWDAFLAVGKADPQQQFNFWLLVGVFGPILLLGLGYAGMVMATLAGVGMLIAEAFAIRSWIYHAANGGLATAIGWTMIKDLRDELYLAGDLKIIVAAGLAGGLCYWLIAGWSAGFWKPAFRNALPPAPPARAA